VIGFLGDGSDPTFVWSARRMCLELGKLGGRTKMA